MKEKNILRLVYVLLIVFNLQYLLWIIQVPYTFLFDDFRSKSTFASTTQLLKSNIENIKDESAVGFLSDTPPVKVFDLVEPIKDFYMVQYAVVPAILKNDTESKFVVGVFHKDVLIDNRLEVYKKINNMIYIFKRRES